MISGLHHYALEVPDLEVADGFLQDFGLETGEKDGSLVARCPGRNQEQIRLVQAPAKRLHHVSFTLTPGTLDPVREALDPARSRRVREFIAFDDPFGNRLELVSQQETITRPVAFARPAGITEFGHLCLDAPDVHEAYRFWSTRFNARVSDWLGDAACLLRIDPCTTSWPCSAASVRGCAT